MYDGYIDEVIYERSQASNNKMLTFVVKVAYTNEEGEEAEKSLRYWAVLEGKTGGRTRKLVAKLDPDTDLEEFDPYSFCEKMEGQEVQVKVAIEKDRDDPKDRVNRIRTIELADGEFADDEE